jgi:hypothetical protein
LAVLNTTLVSVCPDDAKVPLEALGMANNDRLIVRPENSESVWDDANTGLFVITAHTPTPQRIEALQQEGYVNSNWALASPNGRWLLLERKTQATDKITVWISSADGQQQWPLEVSETSQRGRWLNDSAVLLYDAEAKWADLRIVEGAAYYVINPFTLEGATCRTCRRRRLRE